MLNAQAIVGVCGAGAMGAGIAQIAAAAGCRVVVFDKAEEALARGRQSVDKGLGALVSRGKLKSDAADDARERCEWTRDIGRLANAGLVIEAIVEIADAKRALFRQVEEVAGDAAVIATNTSSLSVTSLASGMMRPSRFIGLHFFNPPPVMKLVEVIPGAETDEDVAASALALMNSWGKTAVMVRDVPGFIVNRVARPFYGEGWRALEEGVADAATLDFLYRDLAGFRMGPFELGDLIGHDINAAAAKSIFEAYHGRTRFSPSLMQAQLVSSARLGRKSGRGVYSYTEEERPTPSLVAPSRGACDRTLLDRALSEGSVDVGGVAIMMSDGRPASRVAEETGSPVALLDYVADPAAATAIAYSASCEPAEEAVLSLASISGKSAARLGDRPGLVVFRTLLQLANCAADAVRDRVARPEAIDIAMMNGVNYPFGPLDWAERFGFARAAAALDRIAEETGEAMYRPGEWLRFAARASCDNIRPTL